MTRCSRSGYGSFRQQGWGTSEYLAVLLGLTAVWRGAQALLLLLQRHYHEFSWALMIPF